MRGNGRRPSPAPIVLAVLAAVAVRAGAGGAVPVRAAGCPPPVTPPHERTIVRPRWLSGVLITEYYPAPERWFDGRRVRAPGLPGRHRIDWLYSARGLAMQGEGIGADGRFYHFAGPYGLTWRNAAGRPTLPCSRAPGHWSDGSPAWIGKTWVARGSTVTYPLPAGRWSSGRPVETVPGGSARFAPGPSLSLVAWRDVAVDPRLIPHGSSIFVPAYCGTPSRGWLVAADTGGAIIGPHIDVFRSPPSVPWSSGLHRDAKIFVVPPGFSRPTRLHC